MLHDITEVQIRLLQRQFCALAREIRAIRAIILPMNCSGTRVRRRRKLGLDRDGSSDQRQSGCGGGRSTRYLGRSGNFSSGTDESINTFLHYSCVSLVVLNTNSVRCFAHKNQLSVSGMLACNLPPARISHLSTDQIIMYASITLRTVSDAIGPFLPAIQGKYVPTIAAP